MRRRLSSRSRSVPSSLSLRVLRSGGHGVWRTLVVGGERWFSLHDQIRSKGIILPQDYHTEGVSSPEKRFCHPDCHRASILVETSSEEEHSQFLTVSSDTQKKETSLLLYCMWWREFQVCSCSRSERLFYANHRTRPSFRQPKGARDLFLLEFKPQRAERPKDQNGFFL
jgi:hypothetical protein